MSRNIYRRSNKTGTTSSDLVRDPLNTVAELRAYPVTDILDKTIIYVKAASGVYAYHYDGTGADDGSEIIQPASGNGRWFKVIGGDSYSDEEAQDAVAAALTEGTNVTITYDDTANTITIAATDTNTNQLTEWTVSDGTNDSPVAHNDTVEFTGTGGITITESNKTVTIDGSSISGDTYSITAAQDGANVDLTLDASAGSDSTVQLTAGSNVTLTRNSATEITIAASGGASDNLGNHTATQNLDLDTNNIINVAEVQGPKINFIDATTTESTGDYFFHGKHNAAWGPAHKPAKIIMYASDGTASTESISIQPPSANDLVNSYGLKFPITGPVADKVLKVPTGYSGGLTGTAQLEWADHCCPDAITSITVGAEPSPSGDGAISWNSSTDTLTFTPPDLSGFAGLSDISVGADASASGSGGVSYDNSTGVFTFTPADLSGYATTSSLDAVATSGDYSDLSNKPTIPTNNNELTNGAGYVTSNTQLSDEQVQDKVGAMVSGNTETGISVTYDDSSGKLNFAVTGSDGNFVDDINLSSSSFTTSTTSYYTQATYYVYWSGESTSNEFIIENTQGYSVGSVIRIINMKTQPFTLRTQKNSANVSHLIEVTDGGPQTATNTFSFPGNRTYEFIVNSSGKLFYRT